MNIQVVILDAAASAFDLIAKNSKSEDFLVTNLNQVGEFESILVSTRDSAQLSVLDIPTNLTLIRPKAPTRGALATALLAIDYLSSENPIVLIPTNSSLKQEALLNFIDKMILGNFSAGTLCVRANNPNYSYIRVFNGKVIEVVEKQIVGDLATTGIFFFNNKETLIESARWSFVNNQSTNSNFYIAPCLNYAICKGLDIGYHIVDIADYIHATWNTDEGIYFD